MRVPWSHSHIFFSRTSRNSAAPAAHTATPAAAVSEITVNTSGSKPESDRNADHQSGDCRFKKCQDGCDNGTIAHGRINLNGDNGDKGAVDGSIRWWWLVSVVCSFLASGVLHEAVAFIAMRRTFWPFNTLFLALSASMTPCWDMLFPVLPQPAGCAVAGTGIENVAVRKSATAMKQITARKPVTVIQPVTVTRPVEVTNNTGESCAIQNGGGAASTAVRGEADRSEPELYPAGKKASGATETLPPTFCRAEEGHHPREEAKKGKGSADVRRVRVSGPSIGRSRGWTAVVVYLVASVPLTLAVDYLVWQWWRHAVMEG